MGNDNSGEREEEEKRRKRMRGKERRGKKLEIYGCGKRDRKRGGREEDGKEGERRTKEGERWRIGKCFAKTIFE